MLARVLRDHEEEFKYHVQQVLGNVSNTIKEKELVSFYNYYNKIIDSTGKIPKEEELKEIYFYERDKKTNETSYLYGSRVCNITDCRDNLLFII